MALAAIGGWIAIFIEPDVARPLTNDLDVGIVQYLFTKVPERGGRHALQGAATSE
jgi:hypothetical protein